MLGHCNTCDYRMNKEGPSGECRRYPPQMTFVMMPVQTGNVLEKRVAVVPQGLAGYPIVNDDQGCGEHVSAGAPNAIVMPREH